jgi:hypothetical protein
MPTPPETSSPTGQEPEFHIMPHVTVRNLPVIYSRNQVEAVLALGRKIIDPLRELRRFEAYQEHPLSEEHMRRLNLRLAADEMELTQTKKGLRMRANRYCRFLLAVAETTPGSEAWGQF